MVIKSDIINTTACQYTINQWIIVTDTMCQSLSKKYLNKSIIFLC
jgi:hypothetical protein